MATPQAAGGRRQHDAAELRRRPERGGHGHRPDRAGHHHRPGELSVSRRGEQQEEHTPILHALSTRWSYE